MNYYFDESGNWQEVQKEEVSFIMTGVAVVDERTFNTQYVSDFKEIQTANGLGGHSFHAADLRRSGKSDVLSMIHNKIIEAIDNDVIVVKALFLEPHKVKMTKKSSDDIYIDYASCLLSFLMMGDSFPKVFSDMKFNGAHPVKMAEYLLRGNKVNISDSNLNELMESTSLKSSSVPRLMAEVTRILEYKLQWQDEEQVRKLLNKLQRCDVELLHRYKFFEYWINRDEKDNIREKYRVEIERKLNAAGRDLGIVEPVSVPKVEFMSKSRNEYGIFVADFICNSIFIKIKQASGCKTLDSDEKLCKKLCEKGSFIDVEKLYERL